MLKEDRELTLLLDALRKSSEKYLQLFQMNKKVTELLHEKMDTQNSSPLIRQLLKSMKKLKSLVHSWRMHSTVSRSLKQRWCRLFNKQMGMQRFLEDEETTEDHMVQYRRAISCV
ncbi:hypothetical protein HKD37_04G009657 [Glycine soja]